MRLSDHKQVNENPETQIKKTNKQTLQQVQEYKNTLYVYFSVISETTSLTCNWVIFSYLIVLILKYSFSVRFWTRTLGAVFDFTCCLGLFLFDIQWGLMTYCSLWFMYQSQADGIVLPTAGWHMIQPTNHYTNDWIGLMTMISVPNTIHIIAACQPQFWHTFMITLFFDDSLFIQVNLYCCSKDTVGGGGSNRFMLLKSL